MDQAKILVVEDNAAMRAMIETILLDEGYDVRAAADGVAALQAIETVLPDLIVSDIMMPHMDGYALFEAVRARPAWTAIPFIFLTAKAEKSAVLKGKELGAEDYITKPFALEELLVAVRGRLQRARALQQAAKSDFERLREQIVQMLSHELRTPLTSILGYTELALEDTATMSPASLQEFLAAIQRGAVQLWRLAEDLLLLVRLDTGQASGEFTRVARLCSDLTTTVEEAVDRFQQQAAGRGVTVAVRAEPLATQVRLHEDFFTDALGRLLDNAIKFSPRGLGAPIVVAIHPVQDGVEIAVTDQGHGIAADEIQHLFERFRQIDRGRQEQQGTGIGLAIAQSLIGLHGGQIRVSSAVGRGSTFTIWLPAAQTSEVCETSEVC